MTAPTKPLVLRTRAELIAWRRSLDAQSGQAPLAFVPTMGALHEGHAELLRRARAEASTVALSIFVNPTQFGPAEDLSKYPRTFESDLALAARCGVDVVFAPAGLYDPGFSTWVDETQLSQPLCGRFRPGHFRGVTTVVLKLFNLVRPHRALFGLKDAQQFFVLKKMARDLDLDIELEGVATVREPDGLALSSRNAYLSAAEREIAPMLYRTLASTAKALESLARRTDRARVAGDASTMLLDGAREALTAAGFKPQYLELLALPDLSPLESTPGSGPLLRDDQAYLLATAAHLGATRLIDNVIIHPDRIT